jgi:hypothetical protein
MERARWPATPVVSLLPVVGGGGQSRRPSFFPSSLTLSLLFRVMRLGLYYKLHSAHRPVNMKKPTIKRRKRVPAAPANPVSPSSSLLFP